MATQRTINTVDISFSDGSYVKWRYIGKQMRLYREEKRYAIEVRVENSPQSIDVFFETWDKPSIHTALHILKNAIKDANPEE